jgi:hypothetical protein
VASNPTSDPAPPPSDAEPAPEEAEELHAALDRSEEGGD